MAAYAALTSLEHIIHNLQNHPSPPISIDEQQVRSLTELITSLEVFLEGYNSHLAYTQEADPLETRIADAARAAEAIIESKIVDRIQNCTCLVDDLYGDLQVVIQEMASIKNVALTIQTGNSEVQPQQRRHDSTDVGPFMSSSSSTPSSSVVGFDDVFLQVLESLLGCQLDLQIIPITGMGGIGKTTLAHNIFKYKSVEEHFDIRAWTTISQDYNAQQGLKELLSQTKGNSSGKSESELGQELYQHLFGRRYLIVMDDMWSIEVWNKIQRHLPKFNDGSRVIVTSRLSNLASHFGNGIVMEFLDKDSSLTLFSNIVFDKKSFPIELEEIGKKIIRNCRGLPLSIVTVGGLLRDSIKTPEYWKHIEGNLHSIVMNSEDHEYCLRILKMSYLNLPVHLKPCFLYMGMFEEDYKICVSELIKLWISEGILQPTSKKPLETVGEENLKVLIERNLIQVHELGSTENIKYCKIHDLLRDLCQREAKKERFYPFVPGHSPDSVLEVLQSKPHARSFLCDDFVKDKDRPSLFRRLDTSSGSRYSLKDVFQFFNLRYIALKFQQGYWSNMHDPLSGRFPSSSLNLLWNLQTLNVSYWQSVNAPVEIWNLPHLRHVNFHKHVFLPDPPTGNVVIMANLQTLKTLEYPRLNEEVVRRIPNIKKLAISFGEIEYHIVGKGYDYCLGKLERLKELESFRCSLDDLGVNEAYRLMSKLKFPHSLKKLVLVFWFQIELDEMLKKIGSLPLLQKLSLTSGCFRTGEWVTVEGQFPKLEFLKLDGCNGLERWASETSHFPLLKEIHLEDLTQLEEIPSDIGDIPTLRAIMLKRCNESAVMSMKKIVEDQEESQGEVSFHVRVIQRRRGCESMDLKGLAGPNFEVSRY